MTHPHLPECPAWPGWRSLLFTPADDDRRLQKAGKRGADACILDLEDGVAPERRGAARASLSGHIQRLSAQGADVLIRVNGGLRDLVRDLEAGIAPGLRGVLIPKAESTERLQAVDELIGELEAEAGLAPGTVLMIPMIESASGLLQARALAEAAPRVAALAVGPEDLALDLGGAPDRDLLTEPCRQVTWACAAAGRVAVGFPASIAEFSDMARLNGDLATAQRLGFQAALCVHPRQIEPCHAAFTVSAEALAWARRVEAAFADVAAGGRGVAVVDGRMVDRPVLLRARAVLARREREIAAE